MIDWISDTWFFIPKWYKVVLICLMVGFVYTFGVYTGICIITNILDPVESPPVIQTKGSMTLVT